MQKNKKDKKPLTDVERYQNKMRVIGGIICLVALITAFVIGLFVGKAIERGSTAKDIAVVDTVLTSDTKSTYVIPNGVYLMNDTLVGSFAFGNDGIFDGYTFKISNSDTFTNYTIGDRFGCKISVSGTNSWTYLIYDSSLTSWYSFSDERWYIGRYVLFEQDTPCPSETVYNSFINNSQFVRSYLTYYDVTYELINGVTSPYSNPTIVDNLSTYEILFFSMIGDGDYDYGNNIYLAQNMTVTMTNCTYERVYLDDFIVRYSVSEVVGDVVITATNNRLEKYTEVRKVGSVYEYDIAIGDFDNCFLVNNEILGYSYYVIAPLPDTADQSYSFSITVTFLDVETQKLYTGFESSSEGVTIATPEYPDTYTMKTTVVVGAVGQPVKIVLVNMRLMSPVDDIDPSVAVSFVDWLVVAIGGFFSFSIIPGLSFGLIFGVLMIVMVVRWILNIFAGG